MTSKSKTHMCNNCINTVAKLRCSRCQVTYYCSEECNKDDWDQHKNECCGVSIFVVQNVYGFQKNEFGKCEGLRVDYVSRSKEKAEEWLTKNIHKAPVFWSVQEWKVVLPPPAKDDGKEECKSFFYYGPEKEAHIVPLLFATFKRIMDHRIPEHLIQTVHLENDTPPDNLGLKFEKRKVTANSMSAPLVVEGDERKREEGKQKSWSKIDQF